VSEGNLFAQQESNRHRSTWLVTIFVLFFAWVGFGGDLGFYLLTQHAEPGGYRHTVPFIGLSAMLIAGGIARYAWEKGAERVLWATGAWELIEPATPEQRQLVNVVEEMAIASGQPRPRIWIVSDPDPNAFATGKDPEHASIAVTEGLLQVLDRDELQGVVAHEMAHVANWDIRLMTLLAALTGAIALMSDGLGRTMRGGFRVGGGSGSRGGGKDRGNPLAVLILGVWVFTLLIAPSVTRLLAMAVSRKREFLADATGSQFTRDPQALASALQKLEGSLDATRSITKGAAHLCIVDPGERKIAEREGLLGDVFASHPPMRVRIARLRAMAYQQGTGNGERGV
jgi:heat shock protein HtpX